ncbi:fumarylacetoacetate hydrolase family protein [Devosia sp. XGJD_8]|uniref:fumarylacetoacetate hydrolase family protein n=1 Tax=Devosia sp. XGJD_8 TaxID=3391187 RepID=UPI00398529C5
MQHDGEAAEPGESVEASSTGSSASEAAQLLLEARRTGITLPHLLPHLRPSSQADAHHIQDAIIAQLGSVGGWKIFAGDDAAPFLSPLPATLIFNQGHVGARGPLPIVLVELEIALTLGRDLWAQKSSYDAASVREAVASLHPLIELITFSWTDRDQVDRLTQLSDLQNSAGFVVGGGLSDWEMLDTGNAKSTLIFDGVEQANASTGADTATILRTLALLANHALARGMPLRRGQVITTGARLVAPTGAAKTIRGEIAGLGAVETTLG